MTRRGLTWAVMAIAVMVAAWPARGQDLTTDLAKFLQGFRGTGRTFQTNTVHNTEGDLQQPTTGLYGFGSIITGALNTAITQTVTGTDRTFANNFEAFCFTTGAATQVGYLTVRFKTAGTITAGSYVTAMLYSSSAACGTGKPNANISPVGTGSPANFYSSTLSATYSTATFDLNATLTASTSYWVVIASQSITGGGTWLVDTSNSAVTGNYATNNVDAIGAAGTGPSGTTNWTLVNNISPYFTWNGDTYISVYGYSDNYTGVEGRSLNSWGVRGDSETGLGVYGKSRNDIGTGGASVSGPGVRGSSVSGFGVVGISTGTYGSQFIGTTGGSQASCSSSACIANQLVAPAASVGIQLLQSPSFSQLFQVSSDGVLAVGAAVTTGTNQIGAVKPGVVVFSSLSGSASNGQLVYCSDCTIAATCAGSGTGAIAKRLNGVWNCS